jgi:hypothetical protein
LSKFETLPLMLNIYSAIVDSIVLLWTVYDNALLQISVRHQAAAGQSVWLADVEDWGPSSSQ